MNNKTKPEPETTQAKSTPVVEAKEPSPPPAYPPQNSASVALPADAPDFEKAPDEVLEYYKNPYTAPHPHLHLFDPIFEPAVVHKAPPSKAAYRQQE